jgi:hypothetical protein
MADPLRARVLATVAAARPSTRQQARSAAAMLIAASLAIAVIVFEAVGGFAHGTGRPLHITIALAVGWSLVSGLLTSIVLGRGGSTLSRPPFLVAAAVLAAPWVLYLWMHRFYGTYDEPYQAVGLRCLRYTLVIAALPLASFLGLRRAVEPRHPGILGAGAGVACASWAGAIIDLWCPLTEPMHVLVGHVFPLVIAAIAGALAGHFVLGVRYRSR